MSATLTVNRKCSRCPRVEQTEVSLEDAVRLAKTGLSGPKALRVMFDGEATLELDNLCDTCRTVVQNYLDHIGKKLQHVSSLRQKDDGVDIEIE